MLRETEKLCYVGHVFLSESKCLIDTSASIIIVTTATLGRQVLGFGILVEGVECQK
jgi:hypothetical protein